MYLIKYSLLPGRNETETKSIQILFLIYNKEELMYRRKEIRIDQYVSLLETDTKILAICPPASLRSQKTHIHRHTRTSLCGIIWRDEIVSKRVNPVPQPFPPSKSLRTGCKISDPFTSVLSRRIVHHGTANPRNIFCDQIALFSQGYRHLFPGIIATIFIVRNGSFYLKKMLMNSLIFF